MSDPKFTRKINPMSRDLVIQRLNAMSDSPIVSLDGKIVLDNAIAYLEEYKDAKRLFIRDMLLDMIDNDAPIEAIAWMVQYSRDFIDDMKRKENK